MVARSLLRWLLSRSVTVVRYEACGLEAVSAQRVGCGGLGAFVVVEPAAWALTGLGHGVTCLRTEGLACLTGTPWAAQLPRRRCPTQAERPVSTVGEPERGAGREGRED